MDEFGLNNNALDNPYGILAPTFPRPVRRPAAVMPLPPMAMPPAPRAAPQPFSLGPIGGPTGVGASLPPGRTVVPFRATDERFARNAKQNAPIIGKDMPLERLVDMQRRAESSGNYQALNKEKPGNTASGAYQYTDGTWNNYGGYPKAALAPKEVQDRRFQEDVARRVNKYQGDMFKALADHYLPAFANRPEVWDTPQQIKVGKRVTTVRPVATYLRHVLKGTPYEGQIDAYIASHK